MYGTKRLECSMKFILGAMNQILYVGFTRFRRVDEKKNSGFFMPAIAQLFLFF